MAAHRMTQADVAEAAKVSSAGKLSMWLGRARDQLTPATEAETDARIAAYLDGNAAAAASVDAVPAEAPIPPSAAPSAPAASAGAPRALPAERAQLVRRLEEHMATHSISQARVAEALKLSSTSRLTKWRGASSQSLSAKAEAGIDTAIAAYLDGNNAAPVLVRAQVTAIGGVASLRLELQCQGLAASLASRLRPRERRKSSACPAHGAANPQPAAVGSLGSVTSGCAQPSACACKAGTRSKAHSAQGGPLWLPPPFLAAVLAPPSPLIYNEHQLSPSRLPNAVTWVNIDPLDGPPCCRCAMGTTPAVWHFGRWWCAAMGDDGTGGCGFEYKLPPVATSPAVPPVTEAQSSTASVPVASRVGVSRRRNDAAGSLVCETLSAVMKVPLCKCGRRATWSRGFFYCDADVCDFSCQPPMLRREPQAVAHNIVSRELAQSTAATLTAAAYGPIEPWCFVAPCDCGLGLFARSSLQPGQFISEYDGHRLPARLRTTGQYVLRVPGTSLPFKTQMSMLIDGRG